MAKQNVYQIITDQILAHIEKDGLAPWQKAVKVTVGADGKRVYPMNLISKKAYRGINVWLTAPQGYASPYWLTYKQAQSLGGNVNKGEKATKIVYWNFSKYDEVQKDGSTKEKTVPFLRFFNVWNTEQCDLPEGKVPVFIEAKPEDFNPIEEAQKLADDFFSKKGAPSLTHKGTQAYYSPADDAVTVYNRDYVDSEERYYSSLFHEMGHSTGHASRLGRKAIEEFDFFGSHQYSEEELVAEFTASFLCGIAGVERVVENQAAYLKHWKSKLSDPSNNKIVTMAAQRAQKAADFIQGIAAVDYSKASEKKPSKKSSKKVKVAA